jgi:hypothetical protein
MDNNERIKDITSTGNFDSREVTKTYDCFHNSFTSIEFYRIIHYTNAELYYKSYERENFEECAEEIIHTEKGIIYCFN